MNKGNELKTLKDCLDVCHDDYASPDVLKQEAIKWLKIFDEECKDKTSADELNKINYKYDLNFIPDLGCAVYIIPAWIKHFFNITEDELK
jgi:hypothetical protein